MMICYVFMTNQKVFGIIAYFILCFSSTVFLAGAKLVGSGTELTVLFED